MKDWDSERDPEIVVLALSCDPLPWNEVDLEALHGSIQERALPLLERRHHRVAYRPWAQRARAGLAAAVAASLAAVLLGRAGEPSPAPAWGLIARIKPEVLVTADLPQDEFHALVSHSAETRALLLYAVDPQVSGPAEP